MVQAYNPSPPKVETEDQEDVRGQPWLFSQCKTNPGYMRLCIKRTKKTTKKVFKMKYIQV